MARSPAAWERLAKSWLVEVIERSPLSEVDDLPLGWISQEAAPLIAEILGQLTDPGSARELRLPPAALERAASLASQRGPEAAVRRLPKEFAALQALLIEALDRELPDRDRSEFTRATVRLAEVFGAVQTAAMESLIDERSAGASADPATGLAGPAELHEWLRMLLTETRMSGTPSAVAHFEVEGAERIANGYGEDAAARMVAAVAGVLASQLSERERAFRIGMGQFVAVVPGRDATEIIELAVRVADVIERSQADQGPRVDVTAGIASAPRNGSTPDELLEAAEEAAWAARAAGEEVAVAAYPALQDP
jgi:diguanylate cyclase (GGDEF)-like protein